MNLQRIEQNGFRLVEIIDDTSRTVVWKAVQNTLDRTVIIRVLKPEAAASPVEVDHFLSIARLFARIKSESIAAVFDIVSDGDLHYVVMEHVEGPTLEALIASNGPLAADTVLRVAAALTASLEQMWLTAHIVHRNLKSSTIRLDSRGVAKITDFSLAISGGAGVDASAMDDGHIVGTPCFLSPEQAQGSHLLNTQSDMYALGVVLYHLATGVVPFEDRAVAEILAGHIKGQLPPPHVLNKHLPVSFSWLLHRLMMKNPNNRYADWEEALHDIRAVLSGKEPSCVRPDEEFISTINMAYAAPEADAKDEPAAEEAADLPDTPRLRLNRKARNDEIASYQGQHIFEGHENELRREDLWRSLVCWGLLACWLILVFWFRAFYQTGPAGADSSTPGPVSADASRAPEVAAETPPPAGQEGEDRPPTPPPEQTLQQPAPAPEPPADAPQVMHAGIPHSVIQGLARAFASNDLSAARRVVRETSKLFPEKEPLSKLLEQAQDPDTAVAAFLSKQIDKPLLFERNGKQRTVIPRAVTNGISQLEANGRCAEVAIAKLSADEKLRWMDKPRDAATTVPYCMTLLQTARRDEIFAWASAHPLIAEAFAQAASAAPRVTPPAE